MGHYFVYFVWMKRYGEGMLQGKTKEPGLRLNINIAFPRYGFPR